MFLSFLTEQQKNTFLSLASKICGVDGRLDEKEKIMLSIMKREMDLPQSAQGRDIEIVGISNCFGNRKSKVIVLLELIGLGYADANYSLSESAFITNLAKEFGFSNEDILAMGNWVVRQIALAQEAEEFMQDMGEKE